MLFTSYSACTIRFCLISCLKMPSSCPKNRTIEFGINTLDPSNRLEAPGRRLACGLKMHHQQRPSFIRITLAAPVAQQSLLVIIKSAGPLEGEEVWNYGQSIITATFHRWMLQPLLSHSHTGRVATIMKYHPAGWRLENVTHWVLRYHFIPKYFEMHLERGVSSTREGVPFPD